MKIANFYHGDNCSKVPNIRAYGGMKVVKGKFGDYFELDIKDDETEKFFKIFGEQLQFLAGAYLNEKPWNLKSPIVEYGVAVRPGPTGPMGYSIPFIVKSIRVQNLTD